MGTKNSRDYGFILNGFTLVELVITISIIAILAVISIMFFRGQQLKGNDTKRKADISRIKIAVEEYEKDYNCYPKYVTCGIKPSQPIYPYLNNVPCDPASNASYLYDLQVGTMCPGWFRIYSKLQFTGDPAIIPGIGPGSVFNYVSGSANAPASASSGSSPTSTPDGTGGNSDSQYYGCKSGSCIPVNWNANRPGPECDPTFKSSDCYGQCGVSSTECLSW